MWSSPEAATDSGCCISQKMWVHLEYILDALAKSITDQPTYMARSVHTGKVNLVFTTRYHYCWYFCVKLQTCIKGTVANLFAWIIIILCVSVLIRIPDLERHQLWWIDPYCQGMSKTRSVVDIWVPAELQQIYRGALKGNVSLLNAWVEML